MAYTKTNWINGETPINATNLNNIENGIEANENAIKNIDTQIHYSTEEQVIGTFLGKTLYRKVINFGNLPNSSIKSINHNIQNIDIFTKIYGVATTSTKASYPIPNESTAEFFGGESITIRVNSTSQIQIKTTTDRSADTAIVVLEYTKN